MRLLCEAHVDKDHELVHGIIRLLCEAHVDNDHELVHGIIRLPHEVRVDSDHERKKVDKIYNRLIRHMQFTEHNKQECFAKS